MEGLKQKKMKRGTIDLGTGEGGDLPLAPHRVLAATDCGSIGRTERKKRRSEEGELHDYSVDEGRRCNGRDVKAKTIGLDTWALLVPRVRMRLGMKDLRLGGCGNLAAKEKDGRVIYLVPRKARRGTKSKI